MAGQQNISKVSMLWATVEHAADLSAAHHRLFADGWSKESFEASLSHPGSIALVARLPGQPQQTVGFIVGQLAEDEAEILTVGVVDGWQKSGLATRMVEALVRAAQKGGAKRLFLEVAEDNGAAAALYFKTGFEVTGRRKGYYLRPGHAPVDAITMGRGL